MEAVLSQLSLAWYLAGVGTGVGLTIGALLLLNKFMEQTSPASLEDWPQ